MIVPDPNDVLWGVEFPDIEPPEVEAFVSDPSWESEVLDANGKPFSVRREKQPVGFDLRRAST